MNRKLLIGASFLLLVSLATNLYLLARERGKARNQTSNISDSTSNYPYLSRRVFITTRSDLFISFAPLRQAVRDYIAKYADKIHFYFEYLPSGSSIGVNDRDEIPMASLIKIPTILAVYKKISKGTLVEDTTLIIEQDDLDRDFGDLWRKGAGFQLPLAEVIRLAIVESDNTAQRMLLKLVEKREIIEVYQNLDINTEVIKGKERPIITPYSYSSILKSLYFSLYLLPQYSNKIIDIMTKTLYAGGVSAGINNSVTFAHKIGVLSTIAPPLYSDCGIVYFPKRPYVICVAVRGSEEAAKAHMQTLSKMVFEYVSRVAGQK